jgi:mono/diheme cytochrome c family protein
MFHVAARGIVLSAALLFQPGILLSGQQQADKPKSRDVLAERSGKDMFKAYCASCHGENAKGHGPVAAQLKVPPPDLTTLAIRNHGRFPTDYVNNVIVHGVDTPAHGTSEMPVWGPIFMGINDQRLFVLRVGNLSKYIESLQSK